MIITARSAPTEKKDSHFIQSDASTAEGATKVINEILNRFHGIDIIVHNVGGTSAPCGIEPTPFQSEHLRLAAAEGRKEEVVDWAAATMVAPASRMRSTQL